MYRSKMWRACVSLFHLLPHSFVRAMLCCGVVLLWSSMGCAEVIVWVVHLCPWRFPATANMTSWHGPTSLFGNSLLCLCFNEHFVRVVYPRFHVLNSPFPVFYLLCSSKAHLAGQFSQSWCEDGFQHPDHRPAVFTAHARVQQAVVRLNFAYQACPNSGLFCSHVALVFCNMGKDWHCSCSQHRARPAQDLVLPGSLVQG